MPQPVWMTALPDAGLRGHVLQGPQPEPQAAHTAQSGYPHFMLVGQTELLPPSPPTCGVGEGAPWTPRRTLLPGCRPERGRTPHAV